MSFVPLVLEGNNFSGSATPVQVESNSGGEDWRYSYRSTSPTCKHPTTMVHGRSPMKFLEQSKEDKCMFFTDLFSSYIQWPHTLVEEFMLVSPFF